MWNDVVSVALVQVVKNSRKYRNVWNGVVSVVVVKKLRNLGHVNSDVASVALVHVVKNFETTDTRPLCRGSNMTKSYVDVIPKPGTASKARPSNRIDAHRTT